ncbi:hypothetical protein SD10_08540 [Spirosoma radiotolerans]|uniref:site-specific DNA-methyltransferase (adenine-specific) n=1 Tax=Spirosoma radiotolerans TaxID=1379870 RepID=A0A0E3V6D8_9BACT|nr:hypothetical protein SD10_08540 [Spirosoma radiotolerans]
MKNVFKFLQNSNLKDTREVNKLIVSAFVKANCLQVRHNMFLKDLLISDAEEGHEQMINFLTIILAETEKFDLENLVQLFEFVISPSEKIVNGAVYTPRNIREYIVENVWQRTPEGAEHLLATDLSCGCGGFLLTLTQQFRRHCNKSFSQIFEENIFGIDIADYSIERTKILLSIYALINGEDAEVFNFNLFVANTLAFDWREACPTVAEKGGFDLIVGNPPYVCSRNMDRETMELMSRWEVSRTGHPDLYIPFFQIGYECLNAAGLLGFITVNTFTKSINGRALREYFALNRVNLTLLNFGGEQVFKDRNTYTCICFFDKLPGNIQYNRTHSSQLDEINFLQDLHIYQYENLDNHDGWNLVNDDDIASFIDVVEQTGRPFKELYTTKNGIATLKNDVYKFTPIKSDIIYHYFIDNDQEKKVEISICRDIINSNKVKTPEDLAINTEKIIFPYDEHITIIPEAVMRSDYPFAYNHLLSKREILQKRDKGQREYETWYAYGRRQSMNVRAFKLFFPHICEKPSFVLCEDQNMLFYNGLAIVSENLEDLILIKKILESEIFFKYIRSTTKDYASGYISLSRNYLKNFGIYQFSTAEKRRFLEAEDSNEVLYELYGVENLLATT